MLADAGPDARPRRATAATVEPSAEANSGGPSPLPMVMMVSGALRRNLWVKPGPPGGPRHPKPCPEERSCMRSSSSLCLRYGQVDSRTSNIERRTSNESPDEDSWENPVGHKKYELLNYAVMVIEIVSVYRKPKPETM